jgi:hypothetical protein
MARALRKTMVLRKEAVNGGRDDGDLVMDSDPEGAVVVHTINRTQRRIDRLARKGAIDAREYDAASRLRDAWERAGLEIGQPQARDLETPVGSGSSAPDIVADEASWRRYTYALAQLTRDERRLVVAIVIHDEDPVAWGKRRRCLGLEMLRTCLDKLARYWGL